MGMNLLQNLIMGFVSGLTELLPVSAEAHRSILRIFFGIESEGTVFLLLVHIACLICLILNCRDDIFRIRHTRHQMRIPSRQRKTQPDLLLSNTIRLLRAATIIMVVLKLLTWKLGFIQYRMNYLAVALVFNGILLILPAFSRSGNKDARNMPRLDGFLMGIGAGLSALPGVSAAAGCVSLGIARGVDRKFALRFTYLLMIRVLMVQILFDLIGMIVGGVAFTSMGLLFAVFGAVMAGLGCTLSMRLMNILVSFTGFSGFAYYSWGLGLFSFILFLTV